MWNKNNLKTKKNNTNNTFTSISFINSIYNNKFFIKIFSILAICFIVYKYSNIKNITTTENKSINPSDIIKKLAIINNREKLLEKKQTINTTNNNSNDIYIKAISEYQNKKILIEKNKKRLAEIRKNQITEEQKKQVWLEFFSNNNNEHSPKIKLNDIVKAKYIMVGNGQIITYKPIELTIFANTNTNNLFGKHIIGKKIGDVITIKSTEIFQSLQKITDNINLKDKDINKNNNIYQNIISNNSLEYKIKLIEFKK